MSKASTIDTANVMAEAELSAAAVAPEVPPKGGMTTRVVRGSLWNLGGQAATLLATFVATPFVIRLLGVEAYGLLALINAMIVYMAFADMGMGWASTRFASEAHARGDTESEATVIWTALLVGIGPALVLSLAFMIATRPLVETVLRLPLNLQETASIAFRLAALAFIARALVGVLNTPEIVRLRMDLVTLINVGPLIAQIILVPVVLHFDGGLIGAVVVIAAASGLSACLHAIVAVRLLPSLTRPHIDVSLVKQLFFFGGAIVIMSFLTMLLGNADKALVSRFASVQTLAYYAVALNLASMLTQAPMAMVQSLLPAFSQLQTDPDRTNLHALYQRALRGTLLWIAPSSVLICVIARPFFTVWAGPEFGRESTLPLYVLATGLVLEGLAYVPFTLLIALGRANLVAKIHGAMLLPYLVLASLAITWAGAVGAATLWTLRAAVSFVAFTIVVRRITGFGLSLLPENKQAYFMALAILLFPVIIVSLVSVSLPLRLGITLVAFVAHGIFILARVLTTAERTSLLRLIPFGLANRFVSNQV